MSWSGVFTRCLLQDMVQLLIKAKETGLLERDAEFTKRFVDMQIGLADGTKTVQEVLCSPPQGTPHTRWYPARTLTRPSPQAMDWAPTRE